LPIDGGETRVASMMIKPWQDAQTEKGEQVLQSLTGLLLCFCTASCVSSQLSKTAHGMIVQAIT
jgi:hypothetical protein